MASKQPNVDQLVQTTLDYIKKQAPQEYDTLEKNPAKKAEVVKAARLAIEEELKLANVGDSITQGKTGKNLHELFTTELSKHLPSHRIKMLKEGLQIPTYQLSIRREGAKSFVDVTRSGQKFLESRELAKSQDVSWAREIQYVSILVELVCLVIQAVGITLEIKDSLLKDVTKDVASNSSVLRQAIEHMHRDWSNDSTSEWDRAKALFRLIHESHSLGILWRIIKSLCKHMSAQDWIKVAGAATAMVIAAYAVGGGSLIAKMVLAVDSAYEFDKKLRNLEELEGVDEKITNY